MYDRATNTLWSQLLGEPVIGPLAHSGIKLKVLPVVMTTWGEWLTEHPDTDVLSLETGYYSPRQYQPEDDPGSIYYGYRQSSGTMFPVPLRSDLLETKEYVLGLVLGGESKAYPLRALHRERVVNDAVGGEAVVVVASARSQEARAYRRGDRLFRPAPETGGPGIPTALVDQDGRQWRVTDEALVLEGDPSIRLERVPSHVSYWFGWYAFHTDTRVYGVD